MVPVNQIININEFRQRAIVKGIEKESNKNGNNVFTWNVKVKIWCKISPNSSRSIEGNIGSKKALVTYKIICTRNDNIKVNDKIVYEDKEIIIKEILYKDVFGNNSIDGSFSFITGESLF